MSARTPLLIAALGACTMAAGCDRATAASPVVAQYALATLGAVALPTTPFAGAGITILSDTIRLREDGTGVRDLRYMEGNTRALHGGRTALTWRALGDSLEVSVVCRNSALADCIPAPHVAGRVTPPGRQLVVASAALYSGAPAVYNPVGIR